MTNLRKGVYILPNLFTTASLLCGFYAIITAFERVMSGPAKFQKCAAFIIFAAFFDGLDGRVARRTRTATKFGVEYDSLSDLVSFGVAPAVVLYLWALRGLGSIGWLVPFFYMACGALRLARFNVQSIGPEKKYFTGVPIPMAALMVAGSTLIWEGRSPERAELFTLGDVRQSLLMMTLLLSFLMVSTIPYRSFKSIKLSGHHPFYNMVIVVLALTVILVRPWWLLFLAGWVYLLSGPIERYILPQPVRVYRTVRRRRRLKKALDRIDEIVSAPTSPEPPANVTPIRKP